MDREVEGVGSNANLGIFYFKKSVLSIVFTNVVFLLILAEIDCYNLIDRMIIS